MTNLRLTHALLAFFMLFSLSNLAIAADDEPEPEPTENTQKCEKGSVWDADNKKCVDIKQSQLNDDQIYQTARELAYHGRYQDAIVLLQRAENQQDPRILNYLGFSHRKAGDFDKALSYYQQAIAIKPDYILARSYMGQGYVADGKFDLAALQLAEIRNRGGESTWAYQALSESILTSNGVY